MLCCGLVALGATAGLWRLLRAAPWAAAALAAAVVAAPVVARATASLADLRQPGGGLVAAIGALCGHDGGERR